MIIQDKNTATGELSYFETTLLLYLKESHPHIAGDKALNSCFKEASALVSTSRCRRA